MRRISWFPVLGWFALLLALPLFTRAAPATVQALAPPPPPSLAIVMSDASDAPQAAQGVFPGRWGYSRVTWESETLPDQARTFTLVVEYPYPYVEHYTKADPPVEWSQYVNSCTHDEQNHRFTCEGSFPARDPVETLEAWMQFAFIGTCKLYTAPDPQPQTLPVRAQITYGDGSTSSTTADMRVEPLIAPQLLSRSPKKGATGVVIEDKEHHGPKLTWEIYSSLTCGDGSDPVTQDVGYLVAMRQKGEESWRVFDKRFPTFDRLIQLAPDDLPCAIGGDPATYEWQINAIDLRYAPCGAPPIVFDAHFTTASCRPEVTVKPKYEEFFLSGLKVQNTYRVEVDWNGPAYEPLPKPPYGTVTFDLNGKITTLKGQSWGVEKQYNMGTDFKASLLGGNNVLRIKAAAHDGYESLEETLQPLVFPVPEWITRFALSSFDIDLQAHTVTYGRTVEYPNPHFEARYRVPNWVPYLGGADMGVIETYASVGAEVCSDGSGSAILKGKTGVQLTEAKQVKGSIFGKGDVSLGTGDGLDLDEAVFGLDIKGQIAEEMGVADLVPGLRAAENWWLVGRLVKWFNNRATVEAAVAPQVNIRTKFENQNDELKFKNGTGTGLIDMSLTLTLKLLESLKASLTGGGTPRVVIQVPASGPWGYLRELAIRIYANATLTVWRFEKTWERGITCALPKGTCESDEGEEDLLRAVAAAWHLMGRDYVTDDYATFVGDRAAPSTATRATAETPIVTNVYPLADPALAVRDDGVRVLLWVHDDPTRPLGQGEEIHTARWNGTTWITAALTADDHQDFHPQVAFDAAGNAVAIWERTAIAPVSPTLNITYARAFEIAASAWISGANAWTAPVTLTHNALLDTAPQLARGRDGSLLALWRTGDGYDLLGTAGHPITLTFATWDGSQWLPPTPALVGLTDTLDVRLAVYSATQAALVLARDTDGDLLTGADTELYYATYDGAAWLGPTPLTHDAITDTSPALGYTADGEPIIVWRRGDALVMQRGWSGTPTPVRPDSTSGAFLDFDLAAAPDGNLALIWQALDAEGVNLAYTIYDATGGSWGADQVLMRDEALEEAPAPAFAADGSLYLAYHKVAMSWVTETVVFSPTLTVTVTHVPRPVRTDLYLLHHTIGRDLSLSDADLTLSEANPAPGSRLVVTATVHNSGDLAVTGADVAFYDGDPALGGTLIATRTLPSPFRAASSEAISIVWQLPAVPATHILHVLVDPDGSLAEMDETNNRAQAALVLPDLTVAWAESEGTAGVITLTATLMNVGPLTVSLPFSVAFRATDPLTGQLLGLIPVTAPLASGAQLTVALPLTATAPTASTFWAVADADDAVVEGDEANNAAYAALRTLPDLTVRAADIRLEGRQITVTVRNTGVLSASDVALTVRRAGLNGTLLYSGTVGTLSAGGVASVTFTSTTDIAGATLWAQADPFDAIPEIRESNNLAIRLACTRPITQVRILGPARGYTGSLYAFTATILPTDALTPVTYIWTPAPQTTGTLFLPAASVVTYTWETTGTHVITVTARNCGGSVIATHTVTIEPHHYEIYLPLTARNHTPPPPADRYVRREGRDVGDCRTPNTACRTIQYAVDQAEAGEIIAIAGYTNTYAFPGDPHGDVRRTYWETNTHIAPDGYYTSAMIPEPRQVVYLDKSVTLRGGYSPDFQSWAPQWYKTVLRPGLEGFLGRVVFVAPDATPTLEWLTLLEGQSYGQGGLFIPPYYVVDAGGGLYAMASPYATTPLTVRHCTIAGNYAGYRGHGGGIFLDGRSGALLEANVIEGNTACRDCWGNVQGEGGGLYARYSDGLVVRDNTFYDNVGSPDSHAQGGGLALYGIVDVRIEGNRIISNTATVDGETALGGGLYASELRGGLFVGNVITGNAAGGTKIGAGGGMSFYRSLNVRIARNLVYGNITSRQATATSSSGGGIRISDGCRGIVVENNIIVRNASRYGGGGLLLYTALATPVEVTLRHNTIADNDLLPTTVRARTLPAPRAAPIRSALSLLTLPEVMLVPASPEETPQEAQGVMVDDYVTLHAYNTIIAGQTRGVYDAHPGNSTVVLDHTLWHGNVTDADSSVVRTADVYGDPAFLAPTAYDYHIGAASAARDAGAAVGVTEDFDGEARPYGPAPDIGADEWRE